jgi:thiosulfate sulfurtransferase
MERMLSPASLRALLTNPIRITLLDVRRRPAFEADPTMIPHAVWKDPSQVRAWAAELPRTAPIIVYCVHGHEVSNGVVDHLRGLGLEAALIEGGLEAWKASGGTVVEVPTLTQTEGGGS